MQMRGKGKKRPRESESRSTSINPGAEATFQLIGVEYGGRSALNWNSTPMPSTAK